MLHPQMRIFLAVADCGSFTRAAEKLFLSPTAVMKQINNLEKRLDLRLLDRTSRGIRLTAAGEILYKDAQFLSDYARRSVAEARKAMDREIDTFRVGTSLLNPAKPFMDLWYQVSGLFPDYRLHLVPFEDDHEGILSEIASLGEKFDFLIGVCDSKMWMDTCSFFPLGTYRKMCAVSREHPLAKKKKLKLSDLYGRTLMMVAEGDSEINDRIRSELRERHPQIQIEDTAHFYDISVFNRCAETGNVLLTLECWKDVHPALVTLPVEWDFSIPYGLLYASYPSEDVARFVETLKKEGRGYEQA